MPKFDVLKAIAGRKESGSEMGFDIIAGKQQLRFIRKFIYTVQSFINIFIFFYYQEHIYINMEISKLTKQLHYITI